jgi:hypothetical protein
MGSTTTIRSNIKQIIMGATWFEISKRGTSLSNAYKSACDEAEEEYGHQDGYNGTISTTTDATDETELYNKSKFTSIDAYINSRSLNMNKRNCSAICVEKPVANNNKTKSQVTNLVTKGTKKWVLKYTVGLQADDSPLGSYDTKGEAVEKARKYTEMTGETTEVYMEKLLEKLTPIVARITYKKSTTEKPGKWIFFGYAAE